jgi:hypothetical protein
VRRFFAHSAHHELPLLLQADIFLEAATSAWRDRYHSNDL